MTRDDASGNGSATGATPENDGSHGTDHVSRRGLSRRALLVGGGVGAGLVVGAVSGVLGAQRNETPPEAPGAAELDPAIGDPVTPFGRNQAGISRPPTPQRNTLVVVADVPGEPNRDQILTLLAAASDVITRATDATHPDAELAPDGPGDLSVTIGIGPRLVRAIDATLPGSEALPVFAGDDRIPTEFTGGDLLISVCASDVSLLAPVADAVLEAAGGRMRWSQQGVRGAGSGMVARNPLGYHDGVMVPHDAEAYDEGVWIGEGPASGGTVLVIRRLELDVTAFRALGDEHSDRVIGRERVSGAPLSGGERDDPADLTAKTPEGEYLIPTHAHVRAAHPSFTGSPLMLRRSYGYRDDTGPDAAQGLLFMSYQNSLDTFVRTQRRLDETDELMRYVRCTASGSFLVLPGRASAAEPLGATFTR